MKEYLNTHLTIAFALLLIACAVVLGAWTSHYAQKDLESIIRAHLENQRSYMFSLAEITDRNGADEAISSIIADCPRRVEYESLLNVLGTLGKKDLVTIQNLFESCGTFYAERKALMVAKLERELENYYDLIEFLKILTENTVDVYQYSSWEELVMLEKERSTLLTDQNILQEKIISALISGESVSGREVTGFVQEAQEIAQLLAVADHRIDALRESIQH